MQLVNLCSDSRAFHGPSCKLWSSHGLWSFRKATHLPYHRKLPVGLRLTLPPSHEANRKRFALNASSVFKENGFLENNAATSLPDLPYKVNSTLTVQAWGLLKEGRKYWSSSQIYPYPVGFTSIKLYKGRKFRQEVREGPDSPIFVVEDDNGEVFSSGSLQKVWSLVVGTGVKVNTGRHFGFENKDVVKALQVLGRKTVKDTEIESLITGDDDVHDNASKGRAVTSLEENEELDDIFTGSVPDDTNGVVHSSSKNIRDSTDAQHQLDHIFSDISKQADENQDDGVSEEEENLVKIRSLHVQDGNDEDSEEEAAEGEEEEVEEDEEEVDDDEDEDVDIVESLHVDADEDVDEDEEEDSDKEKDDVEDEDGDEDVDEEDEDRAHSAVDHLSFNFYPKKHERNGHSQSSDARGIFSSEEKHLPRAQKLVTRHGRFNRNGYGDTRTDSMDEGFRGDFGQYRLHSSSRSRNLVVSEKQIWRKGEGLTHGPSYGRQFNSERSGNEHIDLFGDGQSKTSSAFSSSGTRDTSHQRKWDENSRGSQLLLELLRKWDKTKKLGDESGGILGETRQHYIAEETISRYNHSGRKPGSYLQFQGERHADDMKSVWDKLRLPTDINESTDHAVSRLFEMIGKKNGVTSLDESQPKGGNWIADQSKSGAYEEQKADVKSLVKENPKGMRELSTVARTRVFNSKLQSNELIGESKEIVDRIIKMPEKISDVRRSSSEERKFIEDIRKMALSKKFKDVLSAVMHMKLSGMLVNEDVYEAALGLKLDPWQRQVLDFVQCGNSVLVAAPAGAGKATVIECCLYRNIVEKKRTLFVTPYEAAKEEKHAKFANMFGCEIVGTFGPNRNIEKDCDIAVVTVESLAKMLQEMKGTVSSDFFSFLEGVKLVVLDKFHTFGQVKYGNLWEEVMMLLDPRIKVVALTLPVKSEDQVASWIDLNRGPCKQVSSQTEPVPKRYLFGHNMGLLPLFDFKGSQSRDGQIDGDHYDGPMTEEEIESFFMSGYNKAALQHALSVLECNAMLPAIVVFFDVKCCGDAMINALCATNGGLLSNEEIAKVGRYFDDIQESHPYLLKHLNEVDREGLLKGIGTCHEGKLPVWQHFMLRLFRENLLKVIIMTESMLFQTEMVARTIILASSCEVTKHGVSSISSEHLLHLIGSAGRRGHDVEGNVIILKSLYSGRKEAASLFLENAFTITSCFRPSYSFVVNLMANHSLFQAKKILSRSFGDFIFYNVSNKAKSLQEIDRKVIAYLEAKADLEVKLFQQLAEVNKQKLSDAAVFTRVDIRMTIHSASVTGNSLPGFLLAIVPDRTEPFYMVFGADNNFRLLPAGAFDHVYAKEVPPLDVAHKSLTGHALQPPVVPSKESWVLEQDGTYGYIAKGNSETKTYTRLIMEYPVKINVPKEGLKLRKEILALETHISALVEKGCSLKGKRHWDGIKVDGFQLEGDEIKVCDSESLKEVLRLLDILERLDALIIKNGQNAHIQLKPVGMLIAKMYSVENALWLAMVTLSKVVKHALPSEFLSILSTIVPQDPEVASIFSDQKEVVYRITKAVKSSFVTVEALRNQVVAAQGSHVPPLHFDPMMAGIVYAWARAKPGSAGFEIASTDYSDMLWKLRSVNKVVNLVCDACKDVCDELDEPEEFANLSLLAKKGEEMLSKHLTAVGLNIK